MLFSLSAHLLRSQYWRVVEAHTAVVGVLVPLTIRRDVLAALLLLLLLLAAAAKHALEEVAELGAGKQWECEEREE